MRDGWRETTLGEVAVSNNRHVPAATSGLPYYGLEHFDSDSSRIARSGDSTAIQGTAVPVLPGDVLFSKLRPYLNKVAVAEEAAVASTEVLVYRPSTDNLEPAYLGLVLRDKRAIIHAVALSAGSRMPRTSAKAMARLSVAIPPLDVQRRVVDLIAAVDRAVEAAETEAASTRQSVSAFLTNRFATALRGPLTVGDHVEPSAESVNVDPKARYSIVGVLNRGRGLLARGAISGKDTSYTKLNVVGPAMLVYSRLKAFEGSITVTPSDLGQAYASAEFPSFSPLSNTSADWLREITRCPELWQQLAAHSKGMGGRRERLKPADLLKIPLTAPALDEQKELASTARVLREAADAAQETAHALRTLRSSLLTVLLTGEHEIPSSYDALLEGEAA